VQRTERAQQTRRLFLRACARALIPTQFNPDFHALANSLSPARAAGALRSSRGAGLDFSQRVLCLQNDEIKLHASRQVQRAVKTKLM
jgi:hypothetical protein